MKRITRLTLILLGFQKNADPIAWPFVLTQPGDAQTLSTWLLWSVFSHNSDGDMMQSGGPNTRERSDKNSNPSPCLLC